MATSVLSQSHRMLFLKTIGFLTCFSCWVPMDDLVTYLVENGIFNNSVVKFSWILATPILFSYLLQLSGMWTGLWLLILVFSFLYLVWTHLTFPNRMNKIQPDLSEDVVRKYKFLFFSKNLKKQV